MTAMQSASNMLIDFEACVSTVPAYTEPQCTGGNRRRVRVK
jgi:hypothetical protein